MGAISKVLGAFLKLIYDALSGIMVNEPKDISFFALSVIVATIILKVAIIPLTVSQIRNQKKMAEIQPEIEKLKKKYAKDPQTLAVKQQQLMKDSNYNMMSGCLPMIVQMVVLMAFYRVFLYPTQYAFTEQAFADMNKNFFYITNLENIDTTMILPIIAAASTFLMSFIATKNPAQKAVQTEQSKSMSMSMMIVMPVMIFMMGKKFQSGLVLYWIVSNIFAIIQQIITNKMVAKKAEEA